MNVAVIYFNGVFVERIYYDSCKANYEAQKWIFEHNNKLSGLIPFTHLVVFKDSID
jgi:hypothetical protein